MSNVMSLHICIAFLDILQQFTVLEHDLRMAED